MQLQSTSFKKAFEVLALFADRIQQKNPDLTIGYRYDDEDPLFLIEVDSETFVKSKDTSILSMELFKELQAIDKTFDALIVNPKKRLNFVDNSLDEERNAL
jgi:hypothetical protein